MRDTKSTRKADLIVYESNHEVRVDLRLYAKVMGQHFSVAAGAGSSGVAPSTLRSYASLECVAFLQITQIAACCTLGTRRISESQHLEWWLRIRNVPCSSSCRGISHRD